MTLPVITRYVRIDAPTIESADAFDPVTYATVEASARAHIGQPTAQNSGDRWQETDRIMWVDDTTTVPTSGRVTDLATGDIYAVLWTESVVGFGLDHRKVGLRRSDGARP